MVGSSDVEAGNAPAAQAAQLVPTIAGVALIPLITAAVVDGVVKTRLALDRGERGHPDHLEGGVGGQGPAEPVAHGRRVVDHQHPDHPLTTSFPM